MRRLVVLALGLSLLVAAVAAAKGGPSPGVVTGGRGVLSPGGTVRYVVHPSATGTIVVKIRVRDGARLGSATLHGAYGIPRVSYDGTTGGVSADGRTLVLASAGTPTRLAVLSTSSLHPRRLVSLSGTYSFDAISPDGQTIYVIEYGDASYSVRAYDVALGALVPGTIAAKGEAGPMQGFPLSRAEPRSGGWAYTLYGRANGAPFVHALDTAHRVAICIDLSSKLGDAKTVRTLRLSLDGQTLVITRPGAGRVALVDTQSFRVRYLHRP